MSLWLGLLAYGLGIAAIVMLIYKAKAVNRLFPNKDLKFKLEMFFGETVEGMKIRQKKMKEGK